MPPTRYRGCQFEIAQRSAGCWEWTFYREAEAGLEKISSREVAGSRAHAELSLYHAIDQWLSANSNPSQAK